MKHYARSRAWCEWTEFEAWGSRAAQALRRSETATEAIPPFHLLSMPGITAAQQRTSATQWMRQRLQASAEDRARLAAEFNPPRSSAPSLSHALAMPSPKIRLGYLSNDLQNHATAWLMVEMLEAHDRQQFSVHAYSYGADDGQGMRQRLQAQFDAFVDITTMSDTDAARAIHADQIDILIDLKGYTAGSRTSVLTYRPAPVQVSYLGYPGTLGGTFCDYLITDDFVTPPSAAADYTEALACMPHSYQPRGRRHALAPPPTRLALGLPENGFVFCCFNQAYKLTPAVFDIWCQLLSDVPNSVLWLLANPQAEGNLRCEALARGVAPHRLIFAPHTSQAEHLNRLQQADLALDTLPYNAHTTASDALWAGVPLVTCAGDTFASRVAGSVLLAATLPELVTRDLAGYAALALTLAQDAPRLASLRARMARQREDVPLFDVETYTRDLESLYRQMWSRSQAGNRPAALQAQAGERVPLKPA